MNSTVLSIWLGLSVGTLIARGIKPSKVSWHDAFLMNFAYAIMAITLLVAL